MKDFYIVTKHPDLIKYVDYLQKKNAEALSFYPTQVFERESEKGRVFLGLLNNQPCGYIYVGAEGMNVRCHQVCIQYDLRRKLYGAMLVTRMEQYAHQAHSITLRCGFDLDANKFWKELGYVCVAIVDGGIRRQRKINVWRKFLQPLLITQPAIEPAVGKTDASLWRKHKDKFQRLTGFERGNRLKQYRKLFDPAGG